MDESTKPQDEEKDDAKEVAWHAPRGSSKTRIDVKPFTITVQGETVLIEGGFRATAGEYLYLRGRIPYDGGAVPTWDIINGKDWKAMILHIHGIGDHCSKRSDDKWATLLCREGYAFFSFDQFGCGKSGGLKGLLPSYSMAVNDCEVFVSLVTSRFATVPFFISGHSWGGGQAILLGCRLKEKRYYESTWRGEVLLAPAIQNSLEPSAATVWCLRHCFLPCCPNNYSFTPPFNPSQFWSDPKIQEEMRKDELLWTHPMRLRTGEQLLDALPEIVKKLPSVDFPFLLLHGDIDLAVPVSGSKLLYEKSATPVEQKEFRVLENVCHDLFNDPATDANMQMTIEYLNKRTGEQEKKGGGGDSKEEKRISEDPSPAASVEKSPTEKPQEAAGGGGGGGGGVDDRAGKSADDADSSSPLLAKAER